MSANKPKGVSDTISGKMNVYDKKLSELPILHVDVKHGP